MSKKILFISKGENTSSTRYRALQYFPQFKMHGWQTQHSTISGGIIPTLKTFIKVTRVDVVVLLRKTFPLPIFWILRKLSKKLIFDFDDAIFTNTDGSYSKTRMHRFTQTVSKCDYIFAGNQYLANEAKKYNSAVAIIPTSIDVAKYNIQNNIDPYIFELVWIGSSSTKKYITEIIPAIEDAAKSVPNLTLKIIADFELTSPILKINNIAWTETLEAIELSKSNVGLAPMPNNNWTKGKCALKVLQYLATGLPVISSPSGVNAYIVKNGFNGYLAYDINDWSKLIIQAAKEKERLIEMGKVGKKKVSEEFSIGTVFQKMLNIIYSLSE